MASKDAIASAVARELATRRARGEQPYPYIIAARHAEKNFPALKNNQRELDRVVREILSLMGQRKKRRKQMCTASPCTTHTDGFDPQLIAEADALRRAMRESQEEEARRIADERHDHLLHPDDEAFP